MYEMTFYLNEEPDGEITLRVGDEAILKVYLYDANGEDIADPDYTSMDCNLIVRRSDGDSTDEIIIGAEADSLTTDNIWFFDLEDIAYEAGNYEAHVVLSATYEDDDATPIGPATPLDTVFSFFVFPIEVLA